MNSKIMQKNEQLPKKMNKKAYPKKAMGKPAKNPFLKLILTAVIVLILYSISAFAATNVSILYGWNGTDNVPVRVDASGRLMTTINLTESIGLFPDADNLRDLGAASLRWRALYVFDIIAAGNINAGSINASSGLNVTAGNVLLAVTSGNVGIGTTTPDNKLTIRGTDADSYLDVPGILHLNVTDSQNTTLTNIITLDHLLNNPENATNTRAGVMGGIGLGILFRAINNDSEIINVSFINASLVDARNGTEIGALSFYTANKSGSNSRLVPRLILNGSDVFIAPEGSGDTYINPNGGNVGIGTTSPATTLDVKGKANFTGNFSVGQTSNIFFVDNTSGRVGIGTTAPQRILDIIREDATGSTRSVILALTRQTTDTIVNEDGAALEFFVEDNAGNVQEGAVIAGVLTDVTAGSIDSAIYFQTRVNSGAFGERMRIDANGNVGINDSTPTETLDVTGTLSVKSGQSGNAQGLYQNAAGSVGIGTTTPITQLHVIGSITARDSLNASRINATNITSTGLYVDDGTLFVDSVNSRVGIGTTAPTHKLHVVGDANVTNKLYYNVSYSENAQPSYDSIDDDLVLYLPFSRGNETSDPTVFDRSKYGNDGVCSGVSTGCNWTTGPNGNALYFDGVNDNVLAGTKSLPVGSSPRTVSIWLKRTTGSNFAKNEHPFRYGLAQTYNNFGIYGVAGTTGFNFRGNSYDYDTGIDLDDANWHQIVIAFDGTNVNAYKDGILINTTDRSLLNTALDGTGFNIGQSGGANEYWLGSIDEVRVYKRALNNDEIRALYLSGINATLKPYTDSSGKVGINTSTPSATLSVNGTLLVNPLGVTGLAVNPSGRVGIGTTAPAEKLTINGNLSINGHTQIISPASGSVNISFGTTSKNYQRIYYDDNSGDMNFATSINGGAWANTMTLDYGGNIGIGTTSPTKTLHVIGDVNISNNLFIGGNLTFGNTSDYAEMFESDVELKGGDVVCLDEYKKIDKCGARADPSVIGVVSTNPSIIGRTGFEKSYPVGLLGVVPTKVKGPLERFSMLTTSYQKGYAERATAADFGAIIGKSMEACYEDECVIDVIVNLQ